MSAARLIVMAVCLGLLAPLIALAALAQAAWMAMRERQATEH